MKKISTWTIYTGIAFFTFFGILLYFGSEHIESVLGNSGYWGYVMATSVWGAAFVSLFLTNMLAD